MRTSIKPIVAALAALTASNAALAGDPDRTRPGLPWVQFHSPDFTRPAGTGCDRRINLDTGKTISGYARFWIGLLRAPTTGTVHLEAEADDGVQVILGGRAVINGWGLDLPRKGKLDMQAGKLLPIEIRYYQAGATAHLRLAWSWTGHPRELIPAEALCHTPQHAKLIADLMAGRTKVTVQVPCQFPIRSRLYQHGKPERPEGPIVLAPGPHLLIDDHLIERATGVRREVVRPRRSLTGPVVTGAKGHGDDCFQPYMTILRDPATKRFRIWYGVPENASQSHLGYMESTDGIAWQRPHRVLKDPSPIQFGVSILDEGPDFAKPDQRFKYGYYGKDQPGGLRIAVSPDGLTWRPLVDRVVLHHRHDINNIFRDTIRDRYMAIVSTYIPGPHWSGRRRVTLMSHSDDLVSWASPWAVITPNDSAEPGETQFYAMGGFLARGDLLIGMVKVLHDDFSADPGGPKAGVGWTSLAWTRDGTHWTRDTEVFFDRHPQKGQWDHAMAWIDGQLPVGDEVYLYYGGYKQGHKINRFEERQIGLVRIPRDRYVARVAGDESGMLRTPLVKIDGEALTLNVDADGGEVRVQVEDASGRAIDGLSLADCRPIRTDDLNAAVRWRGRLSDVRGKPVRLVLQLRRARLYAFQVR